MDIPAFKNKHAGCAAVIVGKGPHLDALELVRAELNTPSNVIFALNESIHKVESLDMAAPTYVVQQDSELESDCVPKNPNTIHFMNSWQHTPTDSGKKHVEVSAWNPKAVLYRLSEANLSAVAALNIAAEMGIKKVVFVCFDSWAKNKDGRYADVIGKDGGVVGDNGRHSVNGHWIVTVAKQLMDSVVARFPDSNI